MKRRRRHHYQHGDSGCAICGKSIDDPIHIPLIQGDLFAPRDHFGARNTDPFTSHEAARSMEPHLPNVEREILQALLNNDGLTTHEISDVTGIPYWTVTPRLRPMKRKGVAVESGELREGYSGRRCIVWKAVRK